MLSAQLADTKEAKGISWWILRRFSGLATDSLGSLEYHQRAGSRLFVSAPAGLYAAGVGEAASGSGKTACCHAPCQSVINVPQPKKFDYTNLI